MFANLIAEEHDVVHMSDFSLSAFALCGKKMTPTVGNGH